MKIWLAGKNHLVVTKYKYPLSLAINGPAYGKHQMDSRLSLHSSNIVNPWRKQVSLADSLKQAEGIIRFWDGAWIPCAGAFEQTLSIQQSACIWEQYLFASYSIYIYWLDNIFITNSLGWEWFITKRWPWSSLSTELSRRFTEMKNLELLVHYPTIKMKLETHKPRQLLEDFFVTTKAAHLRGNKGGLWF